MPSACTSLCILSDPSNASSRQTRHIPSLAAAGRPRALDRRPPLYGQAPIPPTSERDSAAAGFLCGLSTGRGPDHAHAVRQVGARPPPQPVSCEPHIWHGPAELLLPCVVVSGRSSTADNRRRWHSPTAGDQQLCIMSAHGCTCSSSSPQARPVCLSVRVHARSSHVCTQAACACGGGAACARACLTASPHCTGRVSITHQL